MPLLVPMPSYHPLPHAKARPSGQNMKAVTGVTSVIRLHYGWNVCAHHLTYKFNSTAQCDVAWQWGLWEIIRLLVWISALRKRSERNPLSLPLLRTQ